ncbi:hypothetical protein AMECASPLE_010564 [Ameca splendens]|uniref:Uncharacterized protein n=1 Tax=Ameca splendens TaxID=208324 RepID=A0ABV0XDM5_9TELE
MKRLTCYTQIYILAPSISPPQLVKGSHSLFSPSNVYFLCLLSDFFMCVMCELKTVKDVPMATSTQQKKHGCCTLETLSRGEGNLQYLPRLNCRGGTGLHELRAASQEKEHTSFS